MNWEVLVGVFLVVGWVIWKDIRDQRAHASIRDDFCQWLQYLENKQKKMAKDLAEIKRDEPIRRFLRPTNKDKA